MLCGRAGVEKACPMTSSEFVVWVYKKYWRLKDILLLPSTTQEITTRKVGVYTVFRFVSSNLLIKKNYYSFQKYVLLCSLCVRENADTFVEVRDLLQVWIVFRQCC